jgi:hypothetical protein
MAARAVIQEQFLPATMNDGVLGGLWQTLSLQRLVQTPQWRVENPAERASTKADATIRFTVGSGRGGSGDQRVLMRASKLFHHVLACQRLPHRSERFLIRHPHRAAGPRCTSRHGRCCAPVRAHAGFAYSRCTPCCPRNGRCRRSARVDCSALSSTLKSPIQHGTSPIR